jgi:glutamyl-tRNA synthetase
MEDAIRPEPARLNLGNRDYFGALRVAITGRTASPPLFPTMAVLGKERCLKRLRAAMDKFEA